MKRSVTLIALLLFAACAKAQGPTDTTSFESPTTDIVITNTPGNLWQIGKPQKTFFNAAHSPTHAIVTDTSASVPANDTSSFTYIIKNPYTSTCYSCMEFWHKYDMDSTGDKGLIAASYDVGKSWISLNDTSFGSMGSSFYWDYDFHEANSTYTNHLLVTKGRSNGWIKSNFCWRWWTAIRMSSADTIIINPDTLMIRFTFISDSVVKQKEGWMVDDLVASSAAFWDCSGVQENTARNIISVQPNPFSQQAELLVQTPLNEANIFLLNELGETVRQLKNISGTRVPLSRDGMRKGMYFLQVVQANQVIAVKKLSVID